MFLHRSSRRRPALAAAAIALASTSALIAAPTATSAPPFDSQGYLNSTARCTAPDTVVVFGSTETSRVAICADGDGDLVYRGVRVRDGARLVLPAVRSADGAFTASSNGIDYMVTSSALVISERERVIRDEAMVDFHRASGGAPATAPAPAQEEATPATPLPPPLPAEVGGGEG